MHFYHIVLLDPKDLGEDITEATIEAKVAEVMAPFDEDLEVPPHKDYLDEEDIAAMAKHYGTHDLLGLATRVRDWMGGQGGVDETGLYCLTTRNPQGKWDYWRIGGRWDGEVTNQPVLDAADNGYNFSEEHARVPGNAVLLRTIDHEIRCHSILTPDGEWHECKMPYQVGWTYPIMLPYNDQTEEQRTINTASWREMHDELEAQWFAQRRSLFAKYGYCLAVGVDFHS